MEKFSLENSTKISLYRSILQQKLTFYHLDLLKKNVENNQNINFSQTSRSYFKWFMAMSEHFQYDRTFSNNVLVVGQTGCGKTSFVQILGKNKIFGDRLTSVDWISKINLTKSREDEIRKCNGYTSVEFHYCETFQKDTFDDGNQEIKESNDNSNCNIFGEKKIDKLIVMDDVPDLADKLNDSSNILTASRKFVCTFFHIIYLSKSIWQMILSQTKIFNISLLQFN